MISLWSKTLFITAIILEIASEILNDEELLLDSEHDLLQAVKVPFDDPKHMYFDQGLDGFPAFGIISGSDIKCPYRLYFPEKLYEEFSVLCTVSVKSREGGYVFAVVDPLEMVVQFGVRLLPTENSKLNISLFYTDMKHYGSSTVLSNFIVPYRIGNFLRFSLQISEESVTLFLNCKKQEVQLVKKIPKEIVFDPASTLYIGQAGPYLKGNLDGSLQEVKIFGNPYIAEVQCDDSFQGFNDSESGIYTTPYDDFSLETTGQIPEEGVSSVTDTDRIPYDAYGKDDKTQTDNMNLPPFPPPPPAFGSQDTIEMKKSGKPVQKCEKCEKGDTGPRGFPGSPGSPGPPGPPGQPGVINGSEKVDGDVMGPQGPSVCQCNLSSIFSPENLAKFGTGPPGLPGIEGKQGMPGMTGPEGAAGKEGPVGPVGEKGERGDIGPPGQEGIQGIKGEPGKDGTPGLPGPPGIPGPAGSADSTIVDPGWKPRTVFKDMNSRVDMGRIGAPGPKGDPGIDGLPGMKGERGTTGSKGIRGDKGPKGFKGDKGHQGATGKHGPRGDIGPRGIDGFPGLPGAHGKAGEKGDKGDSGPAGPQGIQGPPGPASAELDLSKIDPSLLRVKGDKGEIGSKGERGLPGERGADGLRGADGPRGTPGSSGPQGQNGTKGEMGPPGPSLSEEQIEKLLPKLRGLKGERGRRGKPGPPGPVGPPGSVSASGVSVFDVMKGDKGDIGPSGKDGIPGMPAVLDPNICKSVCGSSGPPGPPGVSVVGQKGEPGEPGYYVNPSHSTEDGARSIPGKHSEQEVKIVPGAVIFNNRDSLLQQSLSSPIGTIAFLAEEQTLLVRVNNGWQHIQLGSMIPVATESPILFTTTHLTPAPPLESSNLINNYVLKDGPTLKLAALNEPYNGDMHGLQNADYSCYRQSHRAGLQGTFRAFLSSRNQNIDSIVGNRNRDLPVVNTKGEILFSSWKSMFTGDGAKFRSPLRIYSFNGKNILTDPIWPEKVIWHGAYATGKRAMDSYCDAWNSASSDKFGYASSLFNDKLLGEEELSCSNTFAVLCIEVTTQHSKRRRRRRDNYYYYKNITDIDDIEKSLKYIEDYGD